MGLNLSVESMQNPSSFDSKQKFVSHRNKLSGQFVISGKQLDIFSLMTNVKEGLHDKLNISPFWCIPIHITGISCTFV